ncbi:MAG: preprotein translocase subunit SecF [Chloroflexi bacterium]|nr:MAG: preprotein translocase subunit SecF [Chloroflexota bacterium]
MNIAAKRGWFFLISAILLIPGIVFLIIAPGLKPGIDFTGGSTITVEFADPVDQQSIRASLESLNLSDTTVQNFGDNTFFIRTKELTDVQKDDLLSDLQDQLSPSGYNVLSFDIVSPLVAQETVIASFWALFAASIGIFFYVWWAFRNIPKPFRYGTAAIVALLHDAGVIIGVFAILGVVADVEVNTMFLIALLTVIGYSVNDTIVVFDRVRENIIFAPNRSLEANVNLSIGETIGRSVNTSLTLMLTLLALMLFGGQTLRSFLLVLIIGVLVGTYSSIGIATQIVVAWEQQDFTRIISRITKRKLPASE